MTRDSQQRDRSLRYFVRVLSEVISNLSERRNIWSQEDDSTQNIQGPPVDLAKPLAKRKATIGLQSSSGMKKKIGRRMGV